MICDLLALRPISHITKKTLSYLHSTKIEQMTKTMVIFKRGAIFLCCIRCDPIPPQTSVQRLAHTRNVTTCCCRWIFVVITWTHMLDGKANGCSQWFLSHRSVASDLEKPLLAGYMCRGGRSQWELLFKSFLPFDFFPYFAQKSLSIILICSFITILTSKLHLNYLVDLKKIKDSARSRYKFSGEQMHRNGVVAEKDPNITS